MIVFALAAIVAAVGLVRLGWGGRRGAAPVGWALAAAGLAALATRDGAWGIAVGTVAGIVTALALVLHAGWLSAPRTVRTIRRVDEVRLPWRWQDVGRRLLVFVVAVPVAFAAAQLLAFGAQSLARHGGASEADSTVLMLFLQPLAWGVIMSVQMLRIGSGRMVASPAIASLLGVLLWSAS